VDVIPHVVGLACHPSVYICTLVLVLGIQSIFLTLSLWSPQACGDVGCGRNRGGDDGPQRPASLSLGPRGSIAWGGSRMELCIVHGVRPPRLARVDVIG
jgi:hypothetical protein